MRAEDCGQIINMLTGLYPNFHPNFEHAIPGWMLLLGDVPKEAALAVLPKLLAEHTEFAPTPSAIRAAVVETATDLPTSQEAWELTWKWIKSIGSWGRPPEDGPPLVLRTIRAFGWEELCQTDMDDLNTVRSQFRNMYQAFRDKEIEQTHVAIGNGSPTLMVKERTG